MIVHIQTYDCYFNNCPCIGAKEPPNPFDYQENDEGTFEVFDSRDKVKTPLAVLDTEEAAIITCATLNDPRSSHA